jgi:maltose O-acetyltransferase
MTEREKMLAGELYDCGDSGLIERWHLAKRLQQRYNAADSRDRETLDAILDELLGSKGTRTCG